MTTTTTQDEDLIILSDESTSNDIFNFDFSSNDSMQNSSTEVLDFSVSNEEPKQEISFWLSEESTPIIETSNNDFSFSFDLWTNSEVKNLEIQENNSSNDISLISNQEVSLVEDFKETKEIQDIKKVEVLDLNENSFVSNEVSMEKEKVSFDLWDVNSILDQTINQLSQRKDIINSKKDEKSSKVLSLQEQIKKLQKEVSDLKLDVEELDQETLKIDKNISMIEKMKNESFENQERTRKHELEKIKKSK